MTPKEYQEQLPRLRQRIAGLEEQRSYWQSIAEGVTSHISDSPRSKSNVNGKESTYIQCIQAAIRCGQAIETLATLEREAYGLVGQLDDIRYRDILTWRYLNGWKWEGICAALGTSETPMDRTWVWRLHGQALSEFSKLTTQRNITL